MNGCGSLQETQAVLFSVTHCMLISFSLFWPYILCSGSKGLEIHGQGAYDFYTP